MARCIPTTRKYMGDGEFLWCDSHGHEHVSLNNEEFEALSGLQVAREGVRKVFGTLGMHVIEEQHHARWMHGSYFVRFANPHGFMSICVGDTAYGERSRVSGASAVLEVWERAAQDEPTTLTAAELLKTMSERGVIAAVLPPLLIGDPPSGGVKHDAALAVVEDSARVAVRDYLSAHEPTPEYLGTWKRWGVGVRSVGPVAFGSPLEDSHHGELISFQLDAMRRLSVVLPGEASAQSATLLIGCCTTVRRPATPLPHRVCACSETDRPRIGGRSRLRPGHRSIDVAHVRRPGHVEVRRWLRSRAAPPVDRPAVGTRRRTRKGGEEAELRLGARQAGSRGMMAVICRVLAIVTWRRKSVEEATAWSGFGERAAYRSTRSRVRVSVFFSCPVCNDHNGPEYMYRTMSHARIIELHLHTQAERTFGIIRCRVGRTGRSTVDGHGS
jgi:hypothetical protein